jgi:GH24 family phage-related lysozyme (muramidase)
VDKNDTVPEREGVEREREREREREIKLTKERKAAGVAFFYRVGTRRCLPVPHT